MVVSIAVFMEVLDTTIANVALPYIAGGLGVSVDEASWAVTTYLVANAVILTASGFAAKRFGRKPFYLACVTLFAVSSVLCGFAWNLPSLLLFRVLQGLGGGGMVPVSQSILADSFPPAKRGQAFALFGIAVVVAPVVGPTLGGWLSDNWGWQWCFLINGPVGTAVDRARRVVLLKEPKAAVRGARAAEGRRRALRLRRLPAGRDLPRLARGRARPRAGGRLVRLRASSSPSPSSAALAFVLMIPWEATRRHPVVDVRMVASRQFGACFLVMLATGAILLATTQFLPELVQQDFGYTATWAGLALSPGGLVTMAMMLVVGRLSGHVQPKYLIAAGALIIARRDVRPDPAQRRFDFWYFALSRM